MISVCFKGGTIFIVEKILPFIMVYQGYLCNYPEPLKYRAYQIGALNKKSLQLRYQNIKYSSFWIIR